METAELLKPAETEARNAPGAFEALAAGIEGKEIDADDAEEVKPKPLTPEEMARAKELAFANLNRTVKTARRGLEQHSRVWFMAHKMSDEAIAEYCAELAARLKRSLRTVSVSPEPVNVGSWRVHVQI